MWGSSIFGTGDSQWNLQGYTEAAGDWDDFAIEGEAAAMTFVPDNEALVPGVPVYSVFGLLSLVSCGHMGFHSHGSANRRV